MTRGSNSDGIADTSPVGRFAQFSIRVSAPSPHNRLAEVLIELPAGTASVDSVWAPNDRHFSVSEVHGLVHSLHDALMSHLSLTGGVQLSLGEPPL